MPVDQEQLLGLARHEDEVMRQWREGEGSPDEVFVQPFSPAAVQKGVAEIVTVNLTTFDCRWHDVDGNVTGDPFTVYAYSLPVVGGLVGQQVLQNCDPQRVVGDLLRIERRHQYVGNGDFQDGWWAVIEFTKYGCLCPDCVDLP